MPTPRFERARRQLSPTDVILTALEIVHPDVSDPLRVVNDAVDHAIGGENFVALRFEPKLVDDAEGAPRAEIAIYNVGRALTQWVERTSGGSGATCRVIQLVAGTDDIDYDVSLGVARMHVDAAQVRAVIGYEQLFGRRAVRKRHDPETSPGVF